MTKYTKRTVTCSAILVMLASPAHAYLDPGTGSMLIQSAIAALAATGVAARLYWHKIASFLRPRRSQQKEKRSNLPSKDRASGSE